MFPEKSTKIKSYDPEQAFLKALNYCAYQERCQQEVRNKLYEWGLWQEAVENIIVKLIEENYLNEERFAIAYAGGKFRIKHWGKIKIKQGLLFKKVSTPCIKRALSLIDSQEYQEIILKLIQKKSAAISEKNILKKNHTIATYLVGKGFESDVVWDLINESYC